MKLDSTTLHTYLDLDLLKKGFVGFAIIALLLIPANLFVASRKVPGTGNAERYPVPLRVLDEIPSLSQYESAFERGTFFGDYNTKPGVPVFNQSLDELTKNYRLKGIIVLDEPEAILEDARYGKSIFMREGDSLGEVTLAEIKDGYVVLSLGDQKKELRIQ